VEVNPKKKGKMIMIELGVSDEEDASPIKYKDYKIKTMITIKGEIDERFARTTKNKV